MRELKILIGLLSFCITALFSIPELTAQGYGGELTFQGLDNFTIHSAGARAIGGVSIGSKQDVGLMFQNPATLPSIHKFQISLGGQYSSNDLKQEQDFSPVRYYPNLSLLLESRTAQIPNPDTSLIGFTPQDTVQRPYDNIRPNWSHSKSDNMPIQAFIAVPISMDNIHIVGGLGAVEYANLNHYYQNNNVLSPDIFSGRPIPTNRPTGNDFIEVDWLQRSRSRKGSIQGYGFALAGNLEKLNLSVGFSGLFLDGSSDDYEMEVGRGHLVFFENAFRNDSTYSRATKTGTSDFSGQEFTLSSILNGRYVSIGFSFKLPTTITRSYSMQVSTDTTGTPSVSTIKGEDKMKLPLHGTVGLSLAPKENLRIGFEYEFRPYASSKYIDAGGTETSPWLSASLFHVGAEYRIYPWLALRGGIRRDAEVFQPEGNKIEDNPVTFRIYSAGIGVFYSGLRLSVAYEHSSMKYQDVWVSEISKNNEQIHTIVADLSYEIPWIW